jgi:hypothetical protein
MNINIKTFQNIFSLFNPQVQARSRRRRRLGHGRRSHPPGVRPPRLTLRFHAEGRLAQGRRKVPGASRDSP